MKKLLFTINILFFALVSLLGNTFYVDPVNGKITNDGSINHPWSTFSEVIKNNLISSYSNILPFDNNTNKLKIKNPNAPIKAGDTIVLLNGLHGDILIQNYNNKDYITVLAKEGNKPIFEKLRFQGCEKWKFDGIIVSSEPYGHYIKNKLVFIENHNWQGPCKHIDIVNCEIFSSQRPWTKAQDWLNNVSDGVFVQGDSINIVSNIISNIDMGITASGDYINAINNQVINFSGDGMRMLGSNIVFESNVIKNCYNVDANHDDGIQSFTANGVVYKNNIIRSNIIINYEDIDQPLLGPLQGIGCFDGFYENWLIENNVISVNHWHGITLLGATNCRIINNTVLDPTPDIKPGASWIKIENHKDGRPSTGCIVKNNVSNSVFVVGTKSNNVSLIGYDEYEENFVDYKKYDFHLIEGSELIDKGDSIYAPKVDIDNVSRFIYGTDPDIGAYEYKSITSTNKVDDKINIYPNPTSDYIRIEGEYKNHKLFVYNSTGKLMFSSSKNMDKIDVRNFKIGLYYVVITDKEKDILLTQKVIVLRK